MRLETIAQFFSGAGLGAACLALGYMAASITAQDSTENVGSQQVEEFQVILETLKENNITVVGRDDENFIDAQFFHFEDGQKVIVFGMYAIEGLTDFVSQLEKDGFLSPEHSKG